MSVAGEVVSHDVGEMVVEMDRREYVQRVGFVDQQRSSSRSQWADGSKWRDGSWSMRTGDTGSVTDWTAGGGAISARTFQRTSSRPRASQPP